MLFLQTEKIPKSCCILNDDGSPKDVTACQTGTDASAAYINKVGISIDVMDWFKIDIIIPHAV